MPLRHFLRDDDLSHEEQALVLSRAARIKAAPFTDRTDRPPTMRGITKDDRSGVRHDDAHLSSGRRPDRAPLSRDSPGRAAARAV